MSPFYVNKNEQGFTLIEIIVILMIIGILSAIAAPSFLSLLNRNKVNNALSEVRGALQEAQRVATRRSKACQVGLSSGNQPMLTSNCFEISDYIIKASAAASGATTVSVAPLPIAISNGTRLVFSNGATGVVSGNAAKGSTSLTLSSGLSKAIASEEIVAVHTLPNGVDLATNTSGSQITFSFRGNTTTSGTIVLYMTNNSTQEKKCLVISNGLGIIRTGKYSGSTTNITDTDCTKSQ